MSDHDFLSVGIPMGTSRLTISATSVGAMVGYLNDLNEVDETDPEGMSPINSVLDHINTINAAVAVKLPGMAPSAPAASNSAPAQQGNSNVKTCVHGVMTYREGTSNATGKPYKAYFCPAPRGANQCKPEFLN
jgi:hypothetical protein